MATSSRKIILGAHTLIDLPELDLHDIEAKVDTGAYYGAIHCRDVAVVRDGDTEQLAFTLLDEDHPRYNGKRFEVEQFHAVRIKSSNGHVTQRFLVDLDVIVAGLRLRATFSLVDRSHMSMPILIGRELLKNRFVVDVGKESE